MTCEECIHNAICYRRNYVTSDFANKCGDYFSDSVIDDIKAEFISHYPKSVYGELELGGRSCVFSLNDVFEIIDKNIGKERMNDSIYINNAK